MRFRLALWMALGVLTDASYFSDCDSVQTRFAQCIPGRGVCRYHSLLKEPHCVCLCEKGVGLYSGVRCETVYPFSTCNSLSFLTKLINDVATYSRNSEKNDFFKSVEDKDVKIKIPSLIVNKTAII